MDLVIGAILCRDGAVLCVFHLWEYMRALQAQCVRGKDSSGLERQKIESQVWKSLHQGSSEFMKQYFLNSQTPNLVESPEFVPTTLKKPAFVPCTANPKPCNDKMQFLCPA